MPKIYELPASSGVENRSLEIRHAPGSATAQRFNANCHRKIERTV